MEFIDFQNKRWVLRTRVEGHRLDDPTTLKKSYGCDMVIRNSQDIYFILDEVIDVEFEEL